MKRRESALAGMVLECINEVNLYNADAQNATATQISVAGLAEHLLWEVECAAAP